MQQLVPKGARIRVVRDFPTHGLSTWRAAFTGSFEAIIPAGTILVAPDGQREGARGFGVVPEDYDRLEASLVPDDTRLAGKYGGYYFVLLSSDLGDSVEMLS